MSPRIRPAKPTEYRIVVADDDAEDRELFMEAVRGMNYNIVIKFAVDGKNLLDYLHDLLARREKLPDLVMMDVNMPRVNGIEALRAIKRHTMLRELPVAALTTADDKRMEKEMVDLGACGYYTKPNDLEVYKELLIDALAECLPEGTFPVKAQKR